MTLDILTHSVEILNFFLHFNILISHLSRCLSRIIPYALHDISDLLHGMKKTGALMLQRRKVKLLKQTCTQKKTPKLYYFLLIIKCLKATMYQEDLNHRCYNSPFVWSTDHDFIMYVMLTRSLKLYFFVFLWNKPDSNTIF